MGIVTTPTMALASKAVEIPIGLRRKLYVRKYTMSLIKIAYVIKAAVLASIRYFIGPNFAISRYSLKISLIFISAIRGSSVSLQGGSFSSEKRNVIIILIIASRPVTALAMDQEALREKSKVLKYFIKRVGSVMVVATPKVLKAEAYSLSFVLSL